MALIEEVRQREQLRFIFIGFLLFALVEKIIDAFCINGKIKITISQFRDWDPCLKRK